MAQRFLFAVAVVFALVSQPPLLPAQDDTSPFAQTAKRPSGLHHLLMPADQAKRAPLPSRADREKAMESVREVFGHPDDPKRRAALVKGLIKAGREDEEPVNRYAALRHAGELAVEGADLAAAVEVAEVFSEYFDVDVLAIKASLFERLFGKVADRELLRVAASHFDEALAADHFEAAARIGRVGYRAAVAAKDKQQIAAMRRSAARVKKRKAAFEAVKSAIATLNEKPNDAPANLRAGEYLCFHGGHWERGLALLVKGGHSIAKQEVAAEGPAAQKKVGDAWWGLAEKQKGVSKTNFLIRAGYWYEKAFPTLSGLDKRRVKQRLIELESPVVQAFTLPEGIVLSMSFDETSIAQKGGKTIVRDFSGKGNHGVIYGARTATGVRGSCLQFDGKTTYVDLDNSPSLQLTGDITIAFWIYADRFGGRTNPFAKAYGGEYAVSLEKGGALHLVWGVTGGNRGTYKKNQYQNIKLVPPIQAKEWVYIQLVRDMRARKLIGYKNGVKMQEGETAYTSVRPSSDHVFIGKGYAGYFAGKIDELTVWNKALTPEEIRSIAEAYRMGRTISRP